MHARVGLMVLLGTFGATLTSCGTMGSGGTEAATSPAAVLRICQTWPNVTWSSRDTPETVRDAKANNAARRAFCQ